MSLLLRLLSPLIKRTARKAAQANLPQYEGSHRASVDKRVDIVRDRWAVPHIQATNRHDAFFGQGFVHAQDRLWQMEVMRRAAKGQLSEMFGKLTIDSDKIARCLGFGRLGQSDAQRWQHHDILKDLQAYVDGVNRGMELQSQNLPAEMRLLKLKPSPWTVSDSLAIARLIAFQMSYGWAHQLVRLQLTEVLGPEKAADLFLDYPTGNPVALKQGIETYQRIQEMLEPFQGPFLRFLGSSNNWVASAEKMENGAATLCNDPHLLLSLPNIWYENHLICPDYEATGVSITGCPLVLIGHNRQIAWGCTLSFADAQDIYLEQFTGDQARQYKFGDRILKAQVIHERIEVKGSRQAINEEVVLTHHGPVLSQALGHKKTQFSLCSPALQVDNDMLLGFYGLNMAVDWNDFFVACAQIHAPSLNIVYADTQDNIGYVMTGRIPIRRRPNTGLPADGTNPQHDWQQDFVPMEKMPHALNPKQGYLYTCNHKIVGSDYPYDLGNLWMNGYRAARLEQLFQSKTQYTTKDFAQWQMDLYCLSALEFQELLRQLLPEKLSPKAQQASQLLLNWDAQLRANSQGGALYQVFKHELLELLLADAMPAKLRYAIRGQGDNALLLKFNEFLSHETPMLLRLLRNPQSPWWNKHSREQALVLALERSIDELEKRLGKDPKQWQWGKLHAMILKHTLGQQAPLDEIFNLGPFSIGGDADTLCQLSYMPGEHYGGEIMGASYRQIIDMGNLSNSLCISPTGQSGNRLSPHYADQTPLWLSGQLKPMVWTKEQILEHGQFKTVLQP